MVQTLLSEKNKIFNFQISIFKFQISKIENEKLKNRDFCRMRVCACVKDKNLGIFPDVDAVKRREMPNLPLFSFSERVLYAKWTIYPPRSRNASYGLKNGFCAFLT